MLRSLRLRILLAMVVVTVLGVVITVVLANRTTTDLFREYSGRRGPKDAPFVRILEDFYNQNNTWEGVQPLVENLGQAIDLRVLLVDNNGLIIGDSDKSLLGKVMVDSPSSFFPIINKNTPVAKLIIDPFRARAIENEAFLSRLYQSLLIGSTVVLLIVFVVTIFLSRTILQPVEQLTQAALRMEKGDLTTRVNIHSTDEVGKLAQAFNGMAENLARMNQMRRNLVSDVSHELRTPLSNIRGYLEAARDGLLQPDSSLVENLYEETMLLNRLVDDLQDLTMAESGYLKLELQNLEFDPLVRTAVDLSQIQAQKHQVTFDVKIQPDLPKIFVDEQRIVQVLRNLFNNAIDYSPSGGTVKVIALAEDSGVHLSISDSGPGIEAGQLSMIFERFYRADPSRARSTGGAGLGLAIVKQLVELQGGKVWAESVPGQGAVFHLKLHATSYHEE
jgi:signal transduction histidine kinase